MCVQAKRTSYKYAVLWTKDFFRLFKESLMSTFQNQSFLSNSGQNTNPGFLVCTSFARELPFPFFFFFIFKEINMKGCPVSLHHAIIIALLMNRYSKVN